jgi:polyisoprenoid-binding protein YceI
MRRFLTACALLALAACSPKATEAPKSAAPQAAAPAPTLAAKSDAPAGTYALDPSHTAVVFKVSHLGYSHYTANFDRVTGTLKFDPANPAAMTIEAKIDPKSLDLPSPPPGFHDELMGKSWFDAATYPEITFRSTKVEPTGPDTARVTGDFTLHGVTKPVVLETTFNGGYAPNAFDGARTGFSAHGTFKRSDFGMGSGVPAPGSNLGVSDEVAVSIETEFGMGKAVTAAPAAK